MLVSGKVITKTKKRNENHTRIQRPGSVDPSTLVVGDNQGFPPSYVDLHFCKKKHETRHFGKRKMKHNTFLWWTWIFWFQKKFNPSKNMVDGSSSFVNFCYRKKTVERWGHYFTNPNNAFLEKIPQIYHTFAVFDPQIGNWMIPELTARPWDFDYFTRLAFNDPSWEFDPDFHGSPKSSTPKISHDLWIFKQLYWILLMYYFVGWRIKSYW